MKLAWKDGYDVRSVQSIDTVLWGELMLATPHRIYLSNRVALMAGPPHISISRGPARRSAPGRSDDGQN